MERQKSMEASLLRKSLSIRERKHPNEDGYPESTSEVTKQPNLFFVLIGSVQTLLFSVFTLICFLAQVVVLSVEKRKNTSTSFSFFDSLTELELCFDLISDLGAVDGGAVELLLIATTTNHK
ncbi:hypothetical protein AtNW77_Chr1g0054731 [Arabidopsis thaliana]|uniref:Transmembrane protein n=1 Tax=Arabidopsis thaliana x Arabidopsis arenosa TaxID=1240361 RepID=A0A8T2GQ82_9BRAS|nr:hypothetical protein ISN45_At01g046780 [Arabidopsis thaliana x Arabidopsis arenosa]